MKILENNKIDRLIWDNTILKSACPWVFAQSFYLDAVCPQWKALIEGKYRMVMPVTESKKLGLTYLIQPPFTPQLGLFGEWDGAKFLDVTHCLISEYKFISIELNNSNAVFHNGKTKRTYVIEYKRGYKFNSNTKRNISKAIKANLKTDILSDMELLKESKKYLNPFLKNKLKIKKSHVLIFNRLIQGALSAKKIIGFRVVDENGIVLALALFIFNARHAVYLKGCNFDKDKGSMHLLMHAAIEHFRNIGIDFFDFGGGQSSSLAQFYSGFGAQPVEYSIFENNRLPKPLTWLRKK